MSKLICWMFGHRYYFDQIGDCVYRFCSRCNMSGQCMFHDREAEPIHFPREFAKSVAEIYRRKEGAADGPTEKAS